MSSALATDIRATPPVAHTPQRQRELMERLFGVIAQRYDVFNADECFLTGTGAEIIPVVKVDGRVIGTGKPGRITKQLVKQYSDLVQTSGEPIGA